MEKLFVRLFHILQQFIFTTSGRELEYYHKKLNTEVVSRVDERLKTLDFRKLGNLKEIPEMLGTDEKGFSRSPKRQIFKVVIQRCYKLAVKHSTENLCCLVLCIYPKLSVETYFYL